jgi:glycosyltransferase involved in cell wall biosynthesis
MVPDAEAAGLRRILYVQYTNPAGYPPLGHSSRILADQGWEVCFLGTSSRDAENLGFPAHSNLRMRKLTFCAAGWKQKLHYIGFHLWVMGWVLRWRPRWIYASDPMACPAGLLLSFWPGVRVIYHEHDTLVQNGETRPSKFMRFLMWTRARLARRAALNILPSAGRVRLFANDTATSRPVHCVWNCPSTQEIPPGVDGQEDNRALRLYYHGNLSPNLIPPTLIDAMQRAVLPIELRVVGYTTLGNRHDERLRELAGERGMANAVQIEPSVPRHELFAKMCGCQVGIALMPVETANLNFQHMVGASNKVFDYLANGLALLVSDLPEWRRTFVEPGYGLACDPRDADSIVAALRWFSEHPEETRKMGERGRDRIRQEWNYEAQFSIVLKVLNSRN